ncbi:hypothetical protein BDP55DRAFT_196118 [Colletotrichum godetiae]|uniref:Uncharacterized protein n=1 Tax=Colletotrichum godetiae TaxID=1209918 RepID=A0AAJ0AKB6_9PEZI|nr:uncharacterized protein BDP55DRAFT_196118 [Colletotrichum godetiae]KAK1674008.1 hypothetical protein BDP55DRAFT_196118 [Colletotrichum godetiae]
MDHYRQHPAPEEEVIYSQPRPYFPRQEGPLPYYPPRPVENEFEEEETESDEGHIVPVARHQSPPAEVAQPAQNHHEAPGPRTLFFPEATSASQRRPEDALTSDGVHLPRLTHGPAPIFEWDSPVPPQRVGDILREVDYNFGPPWARRRIDERTLFPHDVTLRYTPAHGEEYFREQEARFPLRRYLLGARPSESGSNTAAFVSVVHGNEYRAVGDASSPPGLVYHGHHIPVREREYDEPVAPRQPPPVHFDGLAVPPGTQFYRLPRISERESQERQEVKEERFTGILNTPL